METTTSIFTITENGFAMDGSGKVSVPHCRIKASSYLQAAEMLNQFLSTRVKPEEIELITPMDRIAFDSPKFHLNKHVI